MRRLDRRRRIRFVDVADPDSSCPIDRASLLARFHAAEDGRLYSGAAAFAAMWRAIPLLRPLGLAARNPAVLNVLERLYDLLHARSRATGRKAVLDTDLSFLDRKAKARA